MRSDTPVFCDRVRALKNLIRRFRSLKTGEERSDPAASRPARRFPVSHTIYAQVYPQVVRCNTLQNALSCTPAQKKPTCRVLRQKPNTNRTPISSAFIASVRLNQTYFRKTKPRVRMATVFEPKTALTVRVLQSITVTQKDSGVRLKAWDQRLRHGSGAPIAPFLICPEVGMPGPAGCSASGRNGGHRDGAQTNIENVETTPHANRHNSREPAGHLAAGR